MRVEGGVHGVLGTTCLVGLSLYTFGAIDWGARGVAFFTLLGFVWVLVAGRVPTTRPVSSQESV